MPKNKPNKGLLKRIKVTKTGKIKMNPAFGRHRRSHKPGTMLRGYRRPKYAHASDVKRIASMLFMPVKSRGAKQVETKQTKEE